jgi:hypothetical protein
MPKEGAFQHPGLNDTEGIRCAFDTETLRLCLPKVDRQHYIHHMSGRQPCFYMCNEILHVSILHVSICVNIACDMCNEILHVSTTSLSGTPPAGHIHYRRCWSHQLNIALAHQHYSVPLSQCRACPAYIRGDCMQSVIIRNMNGRMSVLPLKWYSALVLPS